MPSNWRWKIATIVASVVLPVYILVPTLAGWAVSPELEGERGERPIVASLFPKKGLNLGLDLRGGIYVEFDVVLSEALTSRTDIIHTELGRILKDKKIDVTELKRIPDSYRIGATLPDEGAREKFTSFLLDHYNGVLVEERDERVGNSLILTLAGSYIEDIKELTLRQAVETIRGRIDKFGVTEPTIQRLGKEKIAVELPGIKDPDRAIGLIKKGGKLEFQMVDESVKQGDLEVMIAEVRKEKEIAGFSDEAREAIQNALKGKIPDDSEILFEVHFDPISRKVTGGRPYLLKKKVELTGDMLSDAQVQVDTGEPYVNVTFNDVGAQLFSEVTGNNVNKYLAIVLDDRISSVPRIESKIPHGRGRITLGMGDYNSLLREAQDLTLVLREGALPVKLNERTKTVVGPSLGKISIRKGINALLLGAGLVFLFMLVYYRTSGLFANVALLINVALVFAILTLFQATLTLPGLAGIILTMGMAVDANIIVFERIKDELRDGKAPRAAVEAGYSNAMSAVLDANITTFLAGIVLYQFGTGPVRGFAVTLMIGIVTTLITALIITKTMQEYNVFVRRVDKVSI